ncbi:MATE family efflux transporter [Lactiplantibacillus pentosus]|uniref:Multidrug export protein MepA n=1 Tax=Lactiplantibacillus pentosus TaxID=1589 RepID=A0AAW8VUN8_LACPE|nr:MATE family efflux transporter [Lactiplantibacillus pentosus]MBU7472609.1 MATE family efflux transporter [Lactiplantibacillus pentosus]MBU7527867.1 MATE family efflux transporter [Lactiplantibacillus pentosus]MDT6989999.1 MATE family efflux transporter [Lactiplantibacillus pentosus]
MNDLFEKAPIPKAYFHLALPVVLGMVASMIYNLADTFFVAQTGNADLVAGIALGSPLFSFMLAIGDIFGLGGSAVISRALGKHHYEQSARISSFCFYIAIALSLVITALLLVFEQPILGLLGATAATRPYISDFYRILVLGSTFIIVSLVPGNIIRTEGLAQLSMIATISGTVLTILLDPLFLFGFHWGASGVAFANVLGYAVNTGLLVLFMRRTKTLSLAPKLAHVSRPDFKAVVAVGIPASLTNLTQSFGMMILNSYLAAYGAQAVAAMGIVQKIYMVVMMVMVGFAFGAQPLIGYTYGAKNWDRLRATLRFDLKIEGGYASICAIILMLFAPQLIKLFMNQAAIISMGTHMLRAMLLTTPLVGFILVFTTVFQSIGAAMSALTMALSRQAVLLGLAIVILAQLFGLTGIIWAQPVADVLTCLIGWALYHQAFKAIRTAA